MNVLESMSVNNTATIQLGHTTAVVMLDLH